MSILAFDVGDVAIGVARAHPIARLPEPLPAIVNDDKVLETIERLIASYSAEKIVIGLPRTMDGNESQQTKKVRDFGARLEEAVHLPIVFADETLSSVRADAFLKSTKKKYDQDSVAACYILEEYLDHQTGDR